jgi:divalent metal cation (Fe/Co/Zn/Cd) transporter
MGGMFGIYITEKRLNTLPGLLVGALILLSSVRIFKGAIFELTDASVSPSTLQSYRTILDQLPKAHVSSVDRVRAVRSGSSVFMDVDVTLNSRGSARDILEAIESVKNKVRGERKEVKEVRVSFLISGQ